MGCINNKIIQAIHDNGFEEDIWYDNEWMAVVEHKKYPYLGYFICFDEDNKDYSFVTELILKISCTNTDKVLKDIIRYWDEDDFTLTKATHIKAVLVSDSSKLQKSLEEIKQWMDGEAETREISYSLLLSIFVNDELCNFSNLKESEQERIKSEIHRWLEDYESIDSYASKFVMRNNCNEM